MAFVLVQAGKWNGVEADIYLDVRAAAAFFTAAHVYMAETGRPMPEIVEPLGGLRTIAETTEMRWAFDHKGTPASDAIYAKYNMSRVSTARPAINGTHTTGLFFDVATAAFLAWILVNGPRYGITRPLPNDPNHCQVKPGTETVALNATGLNNSKTTNSTPENLMSFKLGYVTDNNGNLFTLFDLVHGRYDQTRDPAVANLWDLLYMPPGVSAQDFGNPAANGSMAVLLGNGGFVHQAWPWPPETVSAPTTTGGASAAEVAAAVDAILKDNFAQLAQQEGTDQAALLAAIGQVDENTLATFGLKRI